MTYNLYNLEANKFSSILNSSIRCFRLFLDSENISKGSIRSYVSDVRFFLNWFTSFLVTNRIFSFDQNIDEISTVLKRVNQMTLDAFKNYQVDKNVPLKTINRRFSSLRRFGLFSQAQNWSSENPFDTLKNISISKPFPEDKHHFTEFEVDLWKNGATKLTIKNYMSDVRQFVSWSEKQSK